MPNLYNNSLSLNLSNIAFSMHQLLQQCQLNRTKWHTVQPWPFKGHHSTKCSTQPNSQVGTEAWMEARIVENQL